MPVYDPSRFVSRTPEEEKHILDFVANLGKESGSPKEYGFHGCKGSHAER